jgi:hypothetical protein
MGQRRVYSPQHFYEIGWDLRDKFVLDLVGRGETNPHRIIRLLQRHEERHEFMIDVTTAAPEARTGKIDINDGTWEISGAAWHPRQPDQKIPLLPTGINIYENVAQGAAMIALPSYVDQTVLPARWMVDMWDDRFDAIVELGSGYGRNLFNILLFGGPTNVPYYAAEYTRSGMALCERLGSLDGSFDIRSVPFDHTQPDFSFLRGEKRLLMFTCHSIEAVSKIPDDYFQRLAAAADHVTCVHFEPFGFQVEDVGETTARQREVVAAKGWNTNFYEVFKHAITEGHVTFTYLRQNAFLNHEYNQTSVVQWKKG